MVALPSFTINTTLAEVDKQLGERAAREEPRTYLGFSQIGDDCERKLWYHVNGVKRLPIPVGGLRCIEDGHRGELLMAERLRMVPGIELVTHAPDGGQWRFNDKELNFSGGMDGAIKGLIEAPATWHVWEHKQVNEKKFDKIEQLSRKYEEKQVLEQWDYQYYCQAVLYMEYSGMTRHYMTIATPGGRDYTSIRTAENGKLAKALREKARRVLSARVAPDGVSKSSAYWKCKMCEFREVCYG